MFVLNILRIFTLLLVFLLLNACATNPVTGRSDFVMMSEEQELALGRQYHQEILKLNPAYDDPELQEYVQAIGSRLAKNSHRSDLVYRFTVLDSPTVNAFALPGGYIYITRGIMAYFDSEAELAGVLGHEIGHVTARHSVRQHSTSSLAQLLGVAVAIGTGSREAAELSNLAAIAAVSGYGRKMELEADRLGAEYLAKTSYDPDEMLNVIRVLKNQEEYEKARAEEEGRASNTYHGVFATHPENDKRLQEVISAANEYRVEGAGATNGRDVYLQKIDGLVFGASESEGVQKGDRFYHRELGFTLRFPQGWNLENHADRLISKPGSADALIQLTMEDQSRHEPIEQFMRKKFSKIKQGELIQSRDYEGFTGLLSRNTPFGKRDVRVAGFYHQQRIVLLMAASKQKANPDDTLFLQTVRSFGSLTSAEQELAKPMRIVIEAASGKQYSELAKDSPITFQAEHTLRLLNHSYPEGEPQPNQRIKLVK